MNFSPTSSQNVGYESRIPGGWDGLIGRVGEQEQSKSRQICRGDVSGRPNQAVHVTPIKWQLGKGAPFFACNQKEKKKKEFVK
jgi:hypothetical protein